MAKTLLAITLFFCCWGCATHLPFPNDRRQIEAEVHRLWAANSFIELDDLEKRIRAQNKLSASGWPLTQLFYQAVEVEQRLPNMSRAQAELEAERAQEWLSKYPNSQLAHFVRVNALMTNAWTIRGTGYANTVTPPQWIEFKRIAGAAADHLEKNKAFLSENSYWYSAMLRIGMQTSMPESTYRQLLEEGWRRYPGHPALYVYPIVHYTPKWGGSSEDMVSFIQWSTATLNGSTADEMYARQYSYAIENKLFPDLNQAGYDCARWLRGTASLINRFPTPYTYNHAALVAVLCKDKNRAKQYFDQVGEKSPDPSIWQKALGRGETFERQRAWSRAID